MGKSGKDDSVLLLVNRHGGTILLVESTADAGRFEALLLRLRAGILSFRGTLRVSVLAVRDRIGTRERLPYSYAARFRTGGASFPQQRLCF
jgi:hypothetical protein